MITLILTCDKISEKGFGSLTEEEKEALQRYSKEMKSF